MSKLQENIAALIDFCQNGAEAEAFALDRTVGADPGFVFIDAARRLVFAGTRQDPSEIMVVTPEEEGFHVTMVKGSDHAAPFLVAMESNDSHEHVVGTFDTPLAAFEAGLRIVDGVDEAPQAPTA